MLGNYIISKNVEIFTNIFFSEQNFVKENKEYFEIFDFFHMELIMYLTNMC